MFKLSGLILAFAYLLSPCALATVYKCDDDGKISYQDTQCDSGIEIITHVQDSGTVHPNTVPSSSPTDEQKPTKTSLPNPN